jgi:hypothetical protein
MKSEDKVGEWQNVIGALMSNRSQFSLAYKSVIPDHTLTQDELQHLISGNVGDDRYGGGRELFSKDLFKD